MMIEGKIQTSTGEDRFVNSHDGKGRIDREMHPKVLKAQQEEAKRVKERERRRQRQRQ